MVATRLSENPAVQVLVVEAGADGAGDPRVTTPGLAVGLLGDEEFDWGVVCEAQVSFLFFKVYEVVCFSGGQISAWDFSIYLTPPLSFQ